MSTPELSPEERGKHFRQLVTTHGWEVAPGFENAVIACELLVDKLQLELVLTLANDIAEIRGTPLTTEILERLVRPPATPTKSYPDEVSPIFEAIESGEISWLREALTEPSVDLDETNDYHDGMTPLLLALYQRDLAMTRLLVEAGADPNARGRYPDAPIHLALLGKGTGRPRALLDAGADPSARDRSGPIEPPPDSQGLAEDPFSGPCLGAI